MIYKEPEKILLIRLSSIGDIILSTPLVRILRNRYPHAVIDFVTKTQYRDLLRTNPHINHLILLDTGKGRQGLKKLKKDISARQYDWFIDIHNNFRSRYLSQGQPGRYFTYRKYKAIRFLLIKFGINLYKDSIPVSSRYINSLSAVNIINDNAGTEFFPDNETRQSILPRLSQTIGPAKKPIVCLAPGAGFQTKRWPIEYFISLAKDLAATCTLYLLGDDNDKNLTSQIAGACGPDVTDFAGQLTIMETACVLEQSGLLISNDSGLMHLAGALHKKTITFFGPTTRELGFFPQQPGAVVLENTDISCRPCSHVGSRKCPKKHFKCMRDIPPQQVLTEIQQLLFS